MSHVKSGESYGETVHRSVLYFDLKHSRRFKTTLKILREITLGEKACQYYLPKKIGGSYRTLLRHLEILRALKFIELDHMEPSSKKGKEKNFWRITFLGLLRLLMEKENLRSIDKIAMKYEEHLPLIFGKWSFFKQRGIKEQIMEYIQKSRTTIDLQIETILMSLDFEDRKRRIDKREKFLKDLYSQVRADPEKLIQGLREFDNYLGNIFEDAEKAYTTAKREINNSILGVVLQEQIWSPEKSTAYLSYLSVLKEDPELRKYITEEVKRIRIELEDKYRRRLRYLKSWEAQWAQL